MLEHHVPLSRLYAECEAIACECGGRQDAWPAYVAVMDRLAANRRGAEAAGWTSCALERDGCVGHLRLFGVPPWTHLRAVVPDPESPSDDWRADDRF